MFMFVAYPWPVPSANIEPPGPKAAVAAPHLPDALAETSTLRPLQIDELICWSWRERLRILWYQFRLTSGEIGRPSRRAREQRLKLPLAAHADAGFAPGSAVSEAGGRGVATNNAVRCVAEWRRNLALPGQMQLRSVDGSCT